ARSVESHSRSGPRSLSSHCFSGLTAANEIHWDWLRMRKNTFGPQIGSRRSNVVVFVPLEKELVKPGTVAHVFSNRFELNSGMTVPFEAPVDKIRTLVSVTEMKTIFMAGGDGGLTMFSVPPIRLWIAQW